MFMCIVGIYAFTPNPTSYCEKDDNMKKSSIRSLFPILLADSS